MEITHFAHEHPLIFKEREEIPFCCNACGLPVLSSPSYICAIEACNFYLHQPCTQLPHESYHYFQLPIQFSDYIGHRGDYGVEKHDLALLARPPHEHCMCSKCGKLCKNFTYQCSKCEFAIDPLCSFPLDIQIKHSSHPRHPLVATCKEALLLCDVCGRKQEGVFFTCHQCNFWVHQDCVLLPNFVNVKHHNHILSLFYPSKFSSTFIVDHRCLICENMTSRMFGAYVCLICLCTIHVGCAASTTNPGTILHLPVMSDGIISSLIVRTALMDMRIDESSSEIPTQKCHPHSLTLVTDIEKESVCNACIRPISPPYYTCSQPECNFVLHKFCAALPLTVDFFDELKSVLFFPRWDKFFPGFSCFCCNKFCNGFGYYGEVKRSFVMFDLECVLAPKIIKHDSHKQHPLVLLLINPQLSASCCAIKNFFFPVYNCSVCGFNIHIHCALLPQTITHKFDKHPLTLMFTSSPEHHSHSTYHLCEFCEEDIDPEYWFYHCTQCDHSFHVNCIPSLGEYSKIKFGGTVKVPCHSDHPLTLVRMLSIGSQTCGYCHEIIEGFKDGMALHCGDCDFWIHFECGKKSSGTNVTSTPNDMVIPLLSQ